MTNAALESLDQHIAWIQAQDARRDEEIRTLNQRVQLLQTEKAAAAEQISGLEAARALVASSF